MGPPVVLVGIACTVLGLASVLRGWDPSIDGLLAVVLLGSLLGGMVLLFPYVATAVWRFPGLAPQLVWPGIQALVVAVALSFVPVINVRGTLAYVVAALGLVLLASALLPGLPWARHR